MIGFDFVKAGSALFTVKFPQPIQGRTHYTYKVERVDGNYMGKETVTYFVKLMTGSDNTDYLSYSYLGIMCSTTGWVKLTAKSCVKDGAFAYKVIQRVLNRLAKNESFMIADAGWTVMHEGKCGRCGRKLTHPTSIETGIGPECATKL
jgi:hypothetical protein